MTGWPPLGTPLTDRELRVLAGIARGLSNAQIGQELHLAENTIKSHTTRLFRRLGAVDRANAVWLAAVRGILRSPEGSVVPCRCSGFSPEEVLPS